MTNFHDWNRSRSCTGGYQGIICFTKKNAGEAMEKLKHTAGIHGCVILSTCNRLEIMGKP